MAGVSLWNSCPKDEGLEHLSAEEKACLLFLEETIQSLDTEEDSTSSTDAPDQPSGPGTVANEPNGPSAVANSLKREWTSTSRSTISGRSGTSGAALLPGSQKTAEEEEKLPAAPAVASRPPSSSTPQLDQVLRSQPPSAAPSKPADRQQKPEAPPAPLEEKVPVPAPTKPRDVLWKTAEGPPPRGPLSYDALVHLRKSTYTKKTPLCPTVDHTIDSGPQPSAPGEVLKPGPDRPHPQAAAAKCPPPVAPKPKIPLAKPSVEPENGGLVSPDPFHGLRNVSNPEVVRLEALHKLGLLKETGADGDTLGPLPPPKPHSFLHPKASRSAKGPSRGPSRGPSKGLSRGPSRGPSSPQAGPVPEKTPLQSSTGLQHLPRCEQQPLTAGCPERPASQQHTNGGPHPAAQPCADPGSAEAPPRSASSTVGYTVMVVPGMGADRREALRKLGLLKDWSA